MQGQAEPSKGYGVVVLGVMVLGVVVLVLPPIVLRW
jgi:hypothetical protein